MESCHKILGVAKNASKYDIRRAYYKKALLYHPDKNNKNDENDENFREVCEAYKALNENKSYINKNNNNVNNNTCFKYNDFLSHFLNFYKSFMKLSETPLTVNIDVSLKDIYYYNVKKIKLKVKRKKTNGGNEFENIVLYISLLEYKEVYIFKEMGDDFPFPIKGRIRSDVHVNIKIIDMCDFKISNVINRFDLYVEKQMSLYTYLYSKNISIKIFNENDELQINNSSCIVVKNKGLPFLNKDGDVCRADLYVYISVDYDIKNKDYLQDMSFEKILLKYY